MIGIAVDQDGKPFRSLFHQISFLARMKDDLGAERDQRGVHVVYELDSSHVLILHKRIPDRFFLIFLIST